MASRTASRRAAQQEQEKAAAANGGGQPAIEPLPEHDGRRPDGFDEPRTHAGSLVNVKLSVGTLLFFQDLLVAVRLSPAAEDFEQAAQATGLAKRELIAALASIEKRRAPAKRSPAKRSTARKR